MSYKTNSQRSRDTVYCPATIRHKEYYLSDGNVIFLVSLASTASSINDHVIFLLKVDNNLFCVHRHFFTRESSVFKDMFSIPVPLAAQYEGMTDADPIHIPQVSCKDFENLLWVWYKP